MIAIEFLTRLTWISCGTYCAVVIVAGLLWDLEQTISPYLRSIPYINGCLVIAGAFTLVCALTPDALPAPFYAWALWQLLVFGGVAHILLSAWRYARDRRAAAERTTRLQERKEAR